VKVVLSAMPVKTDRNDARGLAQLMRLRRFRLVHCKSIAAQEALPLPTARKLVQLKPYDIERSLSGMLRSFGLMVGPTKSQNFAEPISVAGQTNLKAGARGSSAQVPGPGQENAADLSRRPSCKPQSANSNNSQ
jgi:transposase